MTPPGIDSGTVRLVAQRLNHYATPGPYHEDGMTINWKTASAVHCNADVLLVDTLVL